MKKQYLETLKQKGGRHGEGLDEGKATRNLHLILSRLGQVSEPGKRELEKHGLFVDPKNPDKSLQAIIEKMNFMTPSERYNLSKHVAGNHRDVQDAFWCLYDCHREVAPAEVVVEEPVVEKKVSKPLVSTSTKKKKDKDSE